MTVEEMKARMGQQEFSSWVAYVELNGQLSPSRRWDRGPALVAWMLQAIHGGTKQLTDYLPYHSPQSAVELTPEQIEAQLMAAFTPKE